MKKKVDIVGYYLIPLIFFCIIAGMGSFLLGSDFIKVMGWWLMLLCIGITAYPLTGMIFHRFHDGGFIFSKAIGVAVSGVLMWYLSSMHVLKFSRVNSIICIGICLLCSVGLIVYQSLSCKKAAAQGLTAPNVCVITQEKISAALKSEVLFLLFFILWCYLRGFKPEAYGTEKFMDYGFMAIMDRTEFMPPEDMWMAGESINYYYVGQYLATFLSKVAGCGVEYGYNLMLMTVAALGFSMPFSMINNVIRTFFKDKDRKLRLNRLAEEEDKTKDAKKKSGFWCTCLPAIGAAAAGLAVSMAGNMHYLIYRYLVPWFEKLAGMEVSSFWFPNSTRYIGYNPDTADKTIHEFPSYSFVLGDLHAHVINIMFVLTVLGMLFAWLLYRKERMDELRLGTSIRKPELLTEVFHPMILLLGFFIGLFHMTNFWDFPIYFVVAGAVILFSNAVIYQFSIDTIKLTALQAVIILVISKLVAMPFTLNFNQISTEIRLCVYRTPLHQLAVLWGLPILLIAIYLCERYVQLYRSGVLTGLSNTSLQKKRKKRIVGTSSQETDNEINNTEKVKFVPEKNKLFQFIENLQVADLFILTIGLCGIGLILIPEIVYVKDIYSGDYKRANTMFKLTYQAYIMFGMCMAYILVKLIGYTRKRILKASGIVMALCLTTTLGYFGNAVHSWFGNVFDRSGYEGLDATAFIAGQSAQDAEAIAWLKENIEGTPVVLEAHGDSYTFYQRVSAMTGFPTILGWRTHEWLWRSDATGAFPAEVSEREEAVTAIYTSTDETLVRQLIEKYDVEYIYVGASERSSGKFTEPVNEELLRRLGTIVFSSAEDSSGSTTYIIKVDR